MELIKLKYNSLTEINTDITHNYDQYGEMYGSYTVLAFVFDDGMVYKVRFDETEYIDFQDIICFFYGKNFSDMCAEELVNEFCKQTHAHITERYERG